MFSFSESQKLSSAIVAENMRAQSYNCITLSDFAIFQSISLSGLIVSCCNKLIIYIGCQKDKNSDIVICNMTNRLVQ